VCVGAAPAESRSALAWNVNKLQELVRNSFPWLRQKTWRRAMADGDPKNEFLVTAAATMEVLGARLLTSEQPDDMEFPLALRTLLQQAMHTHHENVDLRMRLTTMEQRLTQTEDNLQQVLSQLAAFPLALRMSTGTSVEQAEELVEQESQVEETHSKRFFSGSILLKKLNRVFRHHLSSYSIILRGIISSRNINVFSKSEPF